MILHSKCVTLNDSYRAMLNVTSVTIHSAQCNITFLLVNRKCKNIKYNKSSFFIYSVKFNMAPT